MYGSAAVTAGAPVVQCPEQTNAMHSPSCGVARFVSKRLASAKREPAMHGTCSCLHDVMPPVVSNQRTLATRSPAPARRLQARQWNVCLIIFIADRFHTVLFTFVGSRIHIFYAARRHHTHTHTRKHVCTTREHARLQVAVVAAYIAFATHTVQVASHV